MSTLFAQRRRLVCACYAQFLTSFCFDSSMTLQAVESYSVCFCMIKSKSGYTYCSFFILKEVLWQLIYPNSRIRFIICENVYFAVDDVA